MTLKALEDEILNVIAADCYLSEVDIELLKGGSDFYHVGGIESLDMLSVAHSLKEHFSSHGLAIDPLQIEGYEKHPRNLREYAERLQSTGHDNLAEVLQSYERYNPLKQAVGL